MKATRSALSELKTLNGKADEPQSIAEKTSQATWGEGFTDWPYAIRGGGIVKLTKAKDIENGDTTRPLLGFTVRIVAELHRDDGSGNLVGAYQLEGTDSQGHPFSPQTVPFTEFRSLQWADKWGARAFVYPAPGTKEESRAAIQQLSTKAGIHRETVYTHTGWRELPEIGPVYLTAGCCIGASGAVPGIRVEMTGRLSGYALPAPVTGETLRAAVRASLALLELAPDAVAVVMLGLTYRAPLGDVDFTVWVAGRTGSGKTTYAALCQAHYGQAWTAKHLPASWQSTANALNREAFIAKDVLFIIDDFKPAGIAAEVSRRHAEVSTLLSSAGDRAGRSRLSQDGATVSSGPYPRGSVLTTAEETPRKTSDVARTVAVDVSTPLFEHRGASERFEAARQLAASGQYALALSAYIRWIAANYDDLTGEALKRRVRASASLFAAPHARTPENAAELLEGCRAFFSFAADTEAISLEEARSYLRRVTTALTEQATGQAAYLGHTDPVERFLSLLGSLLRTGEVYLRDAHTGDVPDESVAETLGWSWREYGDPDRMERHWSTDRRGLPVGYFQIVNGQPFIFLEPETVYIAVNRLAEQGGSALPAQSTLYRRLKERLKPLGAMIAEKDRSTHPRRVYGAPPKTRPDFLNLRWPLPDLGGTAGTDPASAPSQPEMSDVPFLFSFRDKEM
ncbi:DUF927 domain-containing protein [Deinococcus sp.]|uniref:DUF927 domain-containing protein n=1 Tax=Deinococcus sp. TaxID=47478 RepID=UPI0025FBA990|nr:DUF927 domain-containing protein [Deinococcus sp.]